MLTIINSHASTIIGNSVKLQKSNTETNNLRDSAKIELAAIKVEADKNGRMFKSLYESLVSGVITADEYKEMREGYETKIQTSMSRSAELKKAIGELDTQISEYIELSDLVADAANTGITAEIIDGLVESIKFYSDKRIDVEFLYDKDFGLVNDILGLHSVDSLGCYHRIHNQGRYDSRARKGDTRA